MLKQGESTCQIYIPFLVTDSSFPGVWKLCVYAREINYDPAISFVLPYKPYSKYYGYD